MNKFTKSLFIIALSLCTSAPLWADESNDSIGTLSIDMTTGSFTSTNAAGTYASVWTSTSTEPLITLTIGVNNMAQSGNNLLLYYTSANSMGTYTLSISDGYQITGYSFTFANSNTSNNMTVTPSAGGSAATCTGSGTAQISVTDLEARNTTFSVTPASAAVVAVNVTDFTVNYKKSGESEPSERQYLFYTYDESGVPYRIPAIDKMPNGNLIALADKRYCNSDIGYGHIDVIGRISTDNGATWGNQFTIMDGNGISGDHACGYGDAALVADCESDTILIMSCTGNVPYGSSTRANPLRTARCYSYDGGQTWTAPEDITEQIYGIFDSRPTGKVTGLFCGSGRICQSKSIKVGSHFRIYTALCTRQGNFVLYSDDLGRQWKPLGKIKNSCAVNGDEPKCEELPNGNVVLSSRTYGGRYFNIFTYIDKKAATGNWRSSAVLSQSQTGGIKVGNNACNGEIYRLKARRNSDGDTVYVMLQSIPAADGRYNVTIFYKELADESDYDTPANFASNWDGSYQVSYTVSAYSTMTLQADNRIAFFYEESPNVYSLVYVPLTLETITNGAYTILEDLPNNINTITTSTPSSGITAEGGEGFVKLQASKSGTANIFSLSGQRLHSRNMKAEESTGLPLPAGVYVVNNQKITVK